MSENMKTSDALCKGGSAGLDRLVEIMRRLRDPDHGCPWDIEQTFATIAPYTIEEAYEVAEAIERNDMVDLQGELGDLLLQVIYHSQMAAEEGHFTLPDVIRQISDKMVRRHPHVFGDQSRDKTAAEQTADWENLKAAERKGDQKQGVLDGVAANLPALTRALKLQNRAARVGFDWPSSNEVLDKIREEAVELAEAAEDRDPQAIEEEYGDLLFVMTNLGRHLKLDPEKTLRVANAKFTRRFQAIEQRLDEMGKNPASSDLQEMDRLWDQVKREEKLTE